MDGGFDELIHPATRLSIVAVLAAADWADFAFVRDQLGLSESALSKQLMTLEEAGNIIVDRKKDLPDHPGWHNVYPRELYWHPAVREAAVVGIPHDELGEEVAAAVVLKPESRRRRRSCAPW